MEIHQTKYKTNKKFLSFGIVPIIAPMGANKQGVKYNINADITAGFISHKMKARRLLMLTDVKGVVDSNNQLIGELKLKEIKDLIGKGVIYGGMIPKVSTCMDAVKKGVRASVIIDGESEARPTKKNYLAAKE